MNPGWRNTGRSRRPIDSDDAGDPVGRRVVAKWSQRTVNRSGRFLAVVAVVLLSMLLAPVMLSICGPGPMGAQSPMVERPMGSASNPVSDIQHGLPDIGRAMSGLNGAFIDNRGQLGNGDVLLYLRGDQLMVGFEVSQVRFALIGGPQGSLPPGNPSEEARTVTTFTLGFEGCRPVTPMGLHEMGCRMRFYNGNDTRERLEDVDGYSEVIYRGLYEHIDLRFYLLEGRLKYEFILEDSANPSDIILKYEGVQGLDLDPLTGEMVVCVGGGQFRDERPVILESIGEVERRTPTEFLLLGGASFGFSIPGSCGGGRPMIIDPGLLFSTYLGGSEYDRINAIDVDSLGDVFVTGSTFSADFPITTGEFQVPVTEDIVVTKLSPQLDNILISTIVQGSGAESANCIKALADGGVLVAGGTRARDFPCTGNAIDTTYNGGKTDGFLFKLDSDGSLVYSTYFGGDNSDTISDIEVDPLGDVILAGGTNSTDLPCNPGALSREYRGSGTMVDALFSVKIDGALSNIIFCTYLNSFKPSALKPDYPRVGLAVDTIGNIYLSAISNGTRGAEFEEAYQPHNRGFDDGLIVKLDPMGSTVLIFTHLGGSWNDEISSIALGPDGSVYVGGWTESPDFPNTSYCRSAGWFNVQAFIARFDPNLTRLELSKIFGGSSVDSTNALSLDVVSGSIIALGQTISTDLPCTPGCVDPIVGEISRLFLVSINQSSEDIEYCSYLGGGGHTQTWEHINQVSSQSLVVGGPDRVFIAGGTFADDFPTTTGTVYPKFRGGKCDGFVMVVDPHPSGPPSVPTGVRAVGGEEHVNVSWDPPPFEGVKVIGHKLLRGEDPGSLDYAFYANGSLNSTLDRNVVPGRTYYYRVLAVNSAGESDRSDMVQGRPFGRPSQPKNPRAISANGTVTIMWEPPEYDGCFEILHFEVLKGTSVENLQPYHTSFNPPFTDEFVEVDMTYVYGVRAVNRLGGGQLATVDVTVNVSPPSAPLDPIIVAGDGNVTLYWLPPESNGGMEITGYMVYRGEAPNIGGMRSWEVSAKPQYHTNRGLKNGVRYYYFITAITERFESAPSTIVSEVPFGPPGYPRGLEAVHGDHQVTLTWQEPDTNGRDIERYVIYFGRSPLNLILLNTSLGTTYKQTGLKNGVPYYFEVSAVNEAGESLVRSNTAEATPMGRPSSPTGLEAILVQEPLEVVVSWFAPDDMGGTTEVGYRIYRLSAVDPMALLAEIDEGHEYRDKAVSTGVTYSYRVVAFNKEGEGLASEKEVAIIRPPGAMGVFNISYGVGLITLTWGPPGLNGGSAIQTYYVWRGLEEDALVERYTSTGTSYMDADVRSNTTYYYAVQAQNTRYRGNLSEVLSITILDPPGECRDFTAVYRDGRIVLSWAPPAADGCAPITGYILYRGTTPISVTQLTELGPVPGYTDTDIESDTKYYYSVVAMSDIGPGDRVDLAVEPPEDSVALLAAGILLFLVLVVSAIVIVRRNAGMMGVEPVDTIVPGVVGPPTPKHIVEEIFVVYRDGRLMATCARDECRTINADLMSGMLIAIQGIIQDGLQRGGELESIKYGENLILLASGPFVNLAVVVYGEPDNELREALEATVQRLETSYAGVLEDWTGDLSLVSGMQGIVAPLIERTSMISRDEIVGVVALQGVSVLSAVDFYHGYVRLKVAAVNTTQMLVADASIEVEYDHDMLRLERVEPETLAVRGDSVSLGNIKPGERKTVAFFFDPQICQGTHIDGMLTYVDPLGERSRVEMKRRHADIVCPIFFTREHANTAMLRKLIAEKLKATDVKVLRYPKEFSPGVMLAMGKSALGGNAVQLVREYIVKGPPFYAEIWYYGETKVHRQQMVIRLGIIEDRQAIELFAASTSMEPITGLLAELRRELDKVIGEGRAGPVRMELERGEDIRRELEERELLLDIIFDEEKEGDRG